MLNSTFSVMKNILGLGHNIGNKKVSKIPFLILFFNFFFLKKLLKPLLLNFSKKIIFIVSFYLFESLKFIVILWKRVLISG